MSNKRSPSEAHASEPAERERELCSTIAAAFLAVLFPAFHISDL